MTEKVVRHALVGSAPVRSGALRCAPRRTETRREEGALGACRHSGGVHRDASGNTDSAGP
jgi:hypothetical protein